jgi:hypothetical protein
MRTCNPGALVGRVPINFRRSSGALAATLLVAVACCGCGSGDRTLGGALRSSPISVSLSLGSGTDITLVTLLANAAGTGSAPSPTIRLGSELKPNTVLQADVLRPSESPRSTIVGLVGANAPEGPVQAREGQEANLTITCNCRVSGSPTTLAVRTSTSRRSPVAIDLCRNQELAQATPQAIDGASDKRGGLGMLQLVIDTVCHMPARGAPPLGRRLDLDASLAAPPRQRATVRLLRPVDTPRLTCNASSPIADQVDHRGTRVAAAAISVTCSKPVAHSEYWSWVPPASATERLESASQATRTVLFDAFETQLASHAERLAERLIGFACDGLCWTATDATESPTPGATGVQYCFAAATVQSPEELTSACTPYSAVF